MTSRQTWFLKLPHHRTGTNRRSCSSDTITILIRLFFLTKQLKLSTWLLSPRLKALGVSGVHFVNVSSLVSYLPWCGWRECPGPSPGSLSRITWPALCAPRPINTKPNVINDITWVSELRRYWCTWKSSVLKGRSVPPLFSGVCQPPGWLQLLLPWWGWQVGAFHPANWERRRVSLIVFSKLSPEHLITFYFLRIGHSTACFSRSL